MKLVQKLFPWNHASVIIFNFVQSEITTWWTHKVFWREIHFCLDMVNLHNVECMVTQIVIKLYFPYHIQCIE
jgi:hypothetical protein